MGRVERGESEGLLEGVEKVQLLGKKEESDFFRDRVFRGWDQHYAVEQRREGEQTTAVAVYLSR